MRYDTAFENDRGGGGVITKPRRPHSRRNRIWDVDTKWFRDEFTRMGVSQNEFCARIDFPRDFFSKIKSGVRDPTMADVFDIASGMGKPVGEVMFRLGMLPGPLSLEGRVCSVVGAIDQDNNVSISGTINRRKVTAPPRAPEDILALREVGTGTMIYYSPAANQKVESGRPSIVMLADGRTLRRVPRLTKNGVSLLDPRTKKVREKDAQIEWAAPIYLIE